jgi:hypothetical protein
MSVTMGNAIRQLKLEISSTDIDLPEQDVSTLHFILITVILFLFYLGKGCIVSKN